MNDGKVKSLGLEAAGGGGPSPRPMIGAMPGLEVAFKYTTL
jgi:hypothetical protein